MFGVAIAHPPDVIHVRCCFSQLTSDIPADISMARYTRILVLDYRNVIFWLSRTKPAQTQCCPGRLIPSRVPCLSYCPALHVPSAARAQRCTCPALHVPQVPPTGPTPVS
eukprot:gene23253-biopygen11815